MFKLIGLLLVFAFSLVSFQFSAVSAGETDGNYSKIIITEIKLGGTGRVFNGIEYKEFVTVYNQTDKSIDFNENGWFLEYAKPSYNLACDVSSWDDEDASEANAVILSGSIAKKSAISIPNLSLTDGIGGSVRIIETQIDSPSIVHDLVGWDKNTESQAPCLDNQSERSPAAWPDGGESIQRFIDCQTNTPIDTDNNQADFKISSSPNPGILSGPLTINCKTEPGNGSVDDSNDQPDNSCKGLLLSELLVNPEGSDSGEEFIELYNQTNKTIKLDDCQLQTTANSKIYKFENDELQPQQFKAIYNGESGLTLANSSGGTVYLIDSDDSELAQTDYPADLDDDVSWSLFSGKWSETFTATPGKANILLRTKACPAGQFRNTQTSRCNNITSSASGLTPCNADQERNPETNRCRKINDSGSSLKPCSPTQTRNPETNRCRGIASLASALKPCAADQFRNPATNRCKKTETSKLKPCKENQQRNSETNRCRNVAGVLSGSAAGGPVQDIKAPATNTGSWWLAAAGVFGAVFYGLWEWRDEALLGLANLKKKFAGAA